MGLEILYLDHDMQKVGMKIGVGLTDVVSVMMKRVPSVICISCKKEIGFINPEKEFTLILFNNKKTSKTICPECNKYFCGFGKGLIKVKTNRGWFEWRIKNT